MRLKRTWLWIGVTTGVVIASAGLGIVFRRHSTCDWLYRMSPQVGEYKSSATASLAAALLGPPMHPTEPRTVFVFGPGYYQRVSDHLDRSATGGPYDMRIDSYWPRSSKSGSCLLKAASIQGVQVAAFTGACADEIAADAHMSVPAGGFIVVVSESPDWFTARLNVVLHFLHLS